MLFFERLPRKRNWKNMLWKRKHKIEKNDLNVQIQKELQELTQRVENVYVETASNGKALKKYSYSMDEIIDMMEQMTQALSAL